MIFPLPFLSQQASSLMTNLYILAEQILFNQLYVFPKILVKLRAGTLKTKKTLPNCVNALQDCGVWMTQILLKRQLKGQSYM